jgi:membrane glycosyltransferase
MSLAETLSRSAGQGSRLGTPGPFLIFAALTAMMSSAITASFAISVAVWTPSSIVALALVSITALWISGGAATAMLGTVVKPPAPLAVPADWTPSERTAILVTLCGETPDPIAQSLAALRRSLDAVGLSSAVEIHVLSDTSTLEAIKREAEFFAPLEASGAVVYRRRTENTGRKPGNIAEWLSRHGDAFSYMAVFDADSRMSAARIRQMIWKMERTPGLGLLQAGIGLAPGHSRFGRFQRLSSRLLTRNFGRGFAAWTGTSGNYWGHNAIMRVSAFRTAAKLPRLSGPAPFGGDVLSHDFIEAAWIRRAGWSVMLDPDCDGSAEGAPQTLAEFHKRDRRWCQGNLQHIRLLFEPGLDPISRLHLVLGVLSYLVAPIWLTLIALAASGAITLTNALPLALVVLVLLTPKLCALIAWPASTPKRRGLVWRAQLGELVTSSLIAPIIMARQTGAVLSVLAGRDCGWKSGRGSVPLLPLGLPEAGLGLALAALGMSNSLETLVWLTPVVLPLISAPVAYRLLDARV